jgi:hypothetical protein
LDGCVLHSSFFYNKKEPPLWLKTQKTWVITKYI